MRLEFNHFENIVGNISHNVHVYTVVLFLLSCCEHCATTCSVTLSRQMQKQSSFLIEQRP